MITISDVKVNNLISDAFDYKDSNMIDIIMSFRDAYKGGYNKKSVFCYYDIEFNKFLCKSTSNIKLKTSIMLLTEIKKDDIDPKNANFDGTIFNKLDMVKDFKSFIYNGKLNDNIHYYLSSFIDKEIEATIDKATELNFVDNDDEIITAFNNKLISIIDFISFKPNYIIFFYNDIVKSGLCGFNEVSDALSKITIENILNLNSINRINNIYTHSLLCKKLSDVIKLNSELSLLALVMLIRLSEGTFYRSQNIFVDIIRDNIEDVLYILKYISSLKKNDDNYSEVEFTILKTICKKEFFTNFNGTYDYYINTIYETNTDIKTGLILNNSRNVYIFDLFKFTNNFKTKSLQHATNLLEFIYKNNKSIFIKDRDVLVKYIKNLSLVSNDNRFDVILNIVENSNNLSDVISVENIQKYIKEDYITPIKMVI